MKKVLLALCAATAFGASAETFPAGTAYAYPIGPDFHYFNNSDSLAALNTNWPSHIMANACSFATPDVPAFGTAAIWFNTNYAQPYTVAEADELCPVVADPWNEGAYALKMQAPVWWGFGNFNFALPASDELCRVRAIFRCDVEGASDARRDNGNGILFRITDDAVSGYDDGVPGPNAKVEIPDIWDHPELYQVVDLYTNDLDGLSYLAITFMPGGFSCGGNQPAFYLEEFSIVPTKLLAGDDHVAGEAVVSALAQRPELTYVEGGYLLEPEPTTGLEFDGIIGNVGETVAIGAKILPADATNLSINWTSSDPEVVAVDADGKVWFNAAGSATVTAECQGHEFSVPFTVKEVIAQALNVFPIEAVGGIGHEFSLLALHEPENTTDKSVTWESSDPNVASVSEDGHVSLAALGTATITAHSGEHSATCSVTVGDIVNLTEMASTGVVIDIFNDGVTVHNAPAGESIAVYTVDGKVVNGAISDGKETHLALVPGIYIVKVSPATIAKVLIKL